MLNSLARSLVLKEKIKTTEAKAKELRPFVEKILTKGKTETIVAKREISAMLGKDAAKIIAGELSKRYKERKGGYTRILKTKPRVSDGSKMAIIELIK